MALQPAHAARDRGLARLCALVIRHRATRGARRPGEAGCTFFAARMQRSADFDDGYSKTGKLAPDWHQAIPETTKPAGDTLITPVSSMSVDVFTKQTKTTFAPSPGLLCTLLTRLLAAPGQRHPAGREGRSFRGELECPVPPQSDSGSPCTADAQIGATEDSSGSGPSGRPWREQLFPGLG